MTRISAFIAGLLFGMGLLLSGMANPTKVLGFLDLAGQWDPSLALVMVGAIGVALLPMAWARYSLLSHTCAGIDPNPKSSLPQGETESQETTGALLKGSYRFFNAGL